MALQGKPPTVPGSNPAQVGAGWRCVKSEEFGQTFIYGEWTYVHSTRPARSHHRQKLFVKILDHFAPIASSICTDRPKSCPAISSYCSH